MNDDLMRYLTGTGFVAIAFLLARLGEDLWSVLPATAGVYILGSMLWEKIKEIK